MNHDDNYSPRELSAPSVKRNSEVNHDEIFVWPWKGIVANLPAVLNNGRYVGESGSKLRDELSK